MAAQPCNLGGSKLTAPYLPVLALCNSRAFAVVPLPLLKVNELLLLFADLIAQEGNFMLAVSDEHQRSFTQV